MNERSQDQDDAFAAMLAAYDAQLATGCNASRNKLDSTRRDLPIDVLERLKKSEQCLQLLERNWPRSKPHDEQPPKSVGRFRIMRTLGRGGFGVVYLAYDERLGREIALKVQRPEAVISRELRERFIRESKAAARLRHPHIAGTYEAGEAGLQIWIASEYVDGGSLAEWLRAAHPLAAPHVAAAFIALAADAIEYSHRQGVLHRDLKPSNVMLQKTDGCSPDADNCLASFVPKLIDFGLAKLGETDRSQTHSRALIGTPQYMAPCAAKGEVHKIGPATDVYGLGVILYELLTGKPAILGETDLDMLRQVVEGEPVRPRTHRPDLSADLEAICLNCLAKDPRQRYQTAAELAEDLRRFLAFRPTLARPLSIARRLAKLARRWPARAALVAVSITASLAIFALAATHIVQLQRTNETTNSLLAQAKTSAAGSKQQELIANQFLYASRMKLADQSLEQGATDEAAEFLMPYDSGKPLAHLRGFEWYHLKRRLHAEQLTLRGHTGEVYAVAFSPDAQQLASGAQDGLIKFWDPLSGQELASIPAHDSCVNSLAYSPDGSILASGSCDSTVKLWDGTTHRLLATLEGHPSNVQCVAFSPSTGKLLASCGNDPVVRIWDVATRQVTKTFDTGKQMIAGLAWRPDETTVILATNQARSLPGGSAVISWDIAANHAVSYAASTNAVAVSPDGAKIYAGTSDGLICQFTGELVQPTMHKGHAKQIDALSISPDGQWLASGSTDRIIRIWKGDVCRQTFIGHARLVQSLCFASDSSTLASASFDGTIKLWSIKDSDPQGLKFDLDVPLYDWPEPGISISARPEDRLAISPDFEYLAVMTRNCEMSVFRIRDRELIGKIPMADYTPGFAFLEDQPVLVGLPCDPPQENHLTAWDVAQWKRIGTHPKPPGRPYQVVYSSEGTTAVAEYGNRVVATDLATNVDFWKFESPSADKPPFVTRPRVYSSPDGMSLAIGLADGSGGWLIDAATKQFHERSEQLRAISDQGDIAAIEGPFTIQLVDTRSGRRISTLRHGYLEVSGIAFSPDAKTLATCYSDGTVYLCSVVTGQETMRFETPASGAASVRFSADSRKLAVMTLGNPRSYNNAESTHGERPAKGAVYSAHIFVWGGIDGD